LIKKIITCGIQTRATINACNYYIATALNSSIVSYRMGSSKKQIGGCVDLRMSRQGKC